MMAHLTTGPAQHPVEPVNKWTVLSDLATARKRYGLSDRDLAVLQALLSFHRATELSESDPDRVVFPSNKSICERLNGMPCSTMRRHLAKLVQSGFLTRRDSPNGKRYTRRYGDTRVAYGFDLTPLFLRAAEVATAAWEAKETKERLEKLRAEISLMRRDLAGLAEFGATHEPDNLIWDQFSNLAVLTQRALRRQLDEGQLDKIHTQLTQALLHVTALLDVPNSDELSINDAKNEQHHQSSNKEHLDKEPDAEDLLTSNRDATMDAKNTSRNPRVSLNLVLSVCTEFLTYTDRKIQSWSDLVYSSDQLFPMMGISRSVWEDAKSAIGATEAAVTLVALLQRFGEIRSPEAYLRSLIKKAQIGAFSCGPMVMALMRKQAV